MRKRIGKDIQLQLKAKEEAECKVISVLTNHGSGHGDHRRRIALRSQILRQRRQLDNDDIRD
jgi:hypothetical protein